MLPAEAPSGEGMPKVPSPGGRSRASPSRGLNLWHFSLFSMWSLWSWIIYITSIILFDIIATPVCYTWFMNWTYFRLCYLRIHFLLIIVTTWYNLVLNPFFMFAFPNYEVWHCFAQNKGVVLQCVFYLYTQRRSSRFGKHPRRISGNIVLGVTTQSFASEHSSHI